jgi:hypothetical protein
MAAVPCAAFLVAVSMLERRAAQHARATRQPVPGQDASSPGSQPPAGRPGRDAARAGPPCRRRAPGRPRAADHPRRAPRPAQRLQPGRLRPAPPDPHQRREEPARITARRMTRGHVRRRAGYPDRAVRGRAAGHQRRTGDGPVRRTLRRPRGRGRAGYRAAARPGPGGVVLLAVGDHAGAEPGRLRGEQGRSRGTAHRAVHAGRGDAGAARVRRGDRRLVLGGADAAGSRWRWPLSPGR